MSYKPVNTYTGATNADDAVVFQIGGAGGIPDCDTFQLGSTNGAMDVFGSGDGTNYLATALALEDLTSTTPATRVQVTAPGKHYVLRGRYKALRVLQNGATAVAGAYLIETESA